MKKIDYFFQHDIEMNGQIVLCKDYNDGEELESTLKDLTRYCPVMRSVSVVPVGLSKYREGLCQLEAFQKEDACRVIDQIEKIQKECMERFGLHFVHASDEFYLLAGRPVPEETRYDGYLQLENGVGMIRLLKEECSRAIAMAKEEGTLPGPAHVSIATGRLAYPLLKECADKLEDAFPQVKIQVIAVVNEFFGEQITVSGLVTGQDLIKQLKDRVEGSKLVIPRNMLRSGENVFLDDVTVDELSVAINCPVIPTETSGYDLVGEVLGLDLVPDQGPEFRPYELDEDELVQMLMFEGE